MGGFAKAGQHRSATPIYACVPCSLNGFERELVGRIEIPNKERILAFGKSQNPGSFASVQAKAMEHVPMVGTDTAERRVSQAPEGWTLLDFRAADQRAAEAIEGSRHIYVGELNKRCQELGKDGDYTLMCASGMRAAVPRAGSPARGSRTSTSISAQWAPGSRRTADRSGLSAGLGNGRAAPALPFKKPMSSKMMSDR